MFFGFFKLHCLPRKKLKTCIWHFTFLCHKPCTFSTLTMSECELLVFFLKDWFKKKKEDDDSRHSLNVAHQGILTYASCEKQEAQKSH